MPSHHTEPVVRIRVHEVDQLFSSIDPSPFRDKDLDPAAEEFLVSWATDLPPRTPITLEVQLDRAVDVDATQIVVREAIHNFFAARADIARRRHRLLIARGWRGLLVGLATLATCLLLAHLIDLQLPGTFAEIIHEGLVIGGWVAIWRPIEFFRYDRWQYRDQLSIFQRLAEAEVRVVLVP